MDYTHKLIHTFEKMDATNPTCVLVHQSSHVDA
jgi:hypothetical protein